MLRRNDKRINNEKWKKKRKKNTRTFWKRKNYEITEKTNNSSKLCKTNKYLSNSNNDDDDDVKNDNEKEKEKEKDICHQSTEQHESARLGSFTHLYKSELAPNARALGRYSADLLTANLKIITNNTSQWPSGY